MLDDLGYRADSAPNGLQALTLTHTNHYQAILMDIGLPDLDGIQVTAKIRQHEQENARLPAYIFVLTAYVLDEVKNDCLMAGVNDMVAKPATANVLENLFSKYGLNKACFDPKL